MIDGTLVVTGKQEDGMKYVYGFLMCFLAFSCASTGDSSENIPDELKAYSQIVDVPSANASTLFVKANSWAVDAFGRADSVIQYSDKEAGIIKGKFAFPIEGGMAHYTITSTITVEVKDGKYRVLCSDPFSSQTWSAWTNKNVDSSPKAVTDRDMLAKIQLEWEDLARRLKEAMTSTADEW